jgi:hypothetical protein
MDPDSWLFLLLCKGCRVTVIGAHQPLLDQVHEADVTRPAQPSGVAIERRLMRHQRQLMSDEQAKHLGQRIDLALHALCRPVLPVEPGAEALVQLLPSLAVEPCMERIGQDLRLRRARVGCQRVELRREVIGKVELVAGLEGYMGRKTRMPRFCDSASMVP